MIYLYRYLKRELYCRRKKSGRYDASRDIEGGDEDEEE